MRPADTSPEAWKVWVDLMRKISPEVKLQRAVEYTAMVRKLCEAGIGQAIRARQEGLCGADAEDFAGSEAQAGRRIHGDGPQAVRGRHSPGVPGGRRPRDLPAACATATRRRVVREDLRRRVARNGSADATRLKRSRQP